MTDLQKGCEQAADLLEKIVLQFESIGWDRHSSYIQTMASHLRIYVHQLESKERGEV